MCLCALLMCVCEFVVLFVYFSVVRSVLACYDFVQRVGLTVRLRVVFLCTGVCWWCGVETSMFFLLWMCLFLALWFCASVFGMRCM